MNPSPTRILVLAMALGAPSVALAQSSLLSNREAQVQQQARQLNSTNMDAVDEARPLRPARPAVPALPAASAPGPVPAQFEAGEPVVVHNLAVVPLLSKKDPPEDDWAVLEEAQANRSVSIAERGEGTVSQLAVANRENRPLFLLGGEVVLGGKQDRMVVTDTVVEAGRTMAVHVNCVEHGRWDGSNLTFRASDAVAHPGLRKAALFEGQGAVWGEVARKSSAERVSSTTGTYRRVLQDAQVRNRIASYLDGIQRQLPASERLVGFGVAINGELELVDVFASPVLVRKLQRKLLASYVLAALERQPGNAADAIMAAKKAKALKGKNVTDFIDESVSEKPAQNNSQVFSRQGKPVHGTYFGKKK